METTTIYNNNSLKLHKNKLLEEIFYQEIVNSENVLQWLEKEKCNQLKEKWKVKEPRLPINTFVQLAHLFSCIVFCLRRNPFFTQSSKPFFVPSLYEHYLDIYDEDLKAYTGMSLEKKQQFQKDLENFVEIITNKKDICIHEFSDISFDMVKKTGLVKKTTNKIQIYANNVYKFHSTLKKGEKEIENLFLEFHSIFNNRKKIKILIKQFRFIMIDFIAKTEDQYVDVLSSWEKCKKYILKL
jgi:hypothetical protein